MQRRSLIQAAAGTVMAQAARPLFAQSATPVRILVGFAAGGGLDACARLVAEQLKESLGRPVLVENRTGASGRLAVEAVKSAAPDGDTLLLAPQGPMTLFPFVYKSLRFDPAKDFTPLGRVVTSDFCLAVPAGAPARDVAGFRQWAKGSAQGLNYGSPGAGTIPHFLGVQIARALGITMTHVPYRGGAPAVLDLTAGTINAIVTPISDPLEMHRAGKVRILATTGAERSRLVSGLPTFREAGVDIDISAWYGLYGPAGLPAAVAARLQAALAAALQGTALQEKLAHLALVAAPSTPAELVALRKRETAFWEPVVKASGFTPED